MIYSLLSLQASEVADSNAVSALNDSKQRVRTMALVHETLYQSTDISWVRADDFVRRLISDLQGVYQPDPKQIRIATDVDCFVIDLDRAIPVGLVLNELVSNAFKYAFPAGRAGEIRVGFRLVGEDMVELDVSDNGVGMPETEAGAQSLGLRLVEALTAQLGAERRREGNGGTHWRIVFRQRSD